MLTLKNLLNTLIFGVMIYFAVQQALEMGDSREWPTVEGVVTASHISRSTEQRSTERYKYEVWVQYSYSVNGMSYTGDRLRIRRNQYSSKNTALRELAEYPVGQRVRVFYDPKAPGNSLLKHI